VSARAEIFLGIIAFATLATAVVQIGLLVAAGLLARRLQRVVERAEREMQPIFEHLNAIGRDASRAASLATAQVERADRLFADVADRVEQTLNAVQTAVNIPVKEGAAVMAGLRAFLSVLRDLRTSRPRPRAEDEDALFI
jgi:hypothetical protein